MSITKNRLLSFSAQILINYKNKCIRRSMKKELFDKYCLYKGIKLTALRREVLSILYASKKPLGAYEILDKLKSERQNAEPPTVYRVLDYLIASKLAHRIESQNTYVCCSQLTKVRDLSRDLPREIHRTILLICTSCNNSFEFDDDLVFISVNKFAQKHGLKIDDALIEIKGVCTMCDKRK